MVVRKLTPEEMLKASGSAQYSLIFANHQANEMFLLRPEFRQLGFRMPRTNWHGSWWTPSGQHFRSNWSRSSCQTLGYPTGHKRGSCPGQCNSCSDKFSPGFFPLKIAKAVWFCSKKVKEVPGLRSLSILQDLGKILGKILQDLARRSCKISYKIL